MDVLIYQCYVNHGDEALTELAVAGWKMQDDGRFQMIGPIDPILASSLIEDGGVVWLCDKDGTYYLEKVEHLGTGRMTRWALYAGVATDVADSTDPTDG